MSQKHIVIDLETLGTRVGSIIFAVGLAIFEEGGQENQIRTEYILIDPASSKNAGLSANADTVSWWKNQKPDAKVELADALLVGQDLRVALSIVQSIIESHEDAQVWGYGADFDIAHLAEVFTRLDIPIPWSYRNVRCARTLLNIPGMESELRKIEFTGVAHNAMDDALFEAIKLKKALETLKLWSSK